MGPSRGYLRGAQLAVASDIPTLASLGGAPVSHTHTVSQISGLTSINMDFYDHQYTGSGTFPAGSSSNIPYSTTFQFTKTHTKILLVILYWRFYFWSTSWDSNTNGLADCVFPLTIGVTGRKTIYGSNCQASMNFTNNGTSLYVSGNMAGGNSSNGGSGTITYSSMIIGM